MRGQTTTRLSVQFSCIDTCSPSDVASFCGFLNSFHWKQRRERQQGEKAIGSQGGVNGENRECPKIPGGFICLLLTTQGQTTFDIGCAGKHRFDCYIGACGREVGGGEVFCA